MHSFIFVAQLFCTCRLKQNGILVSLDFIGSSLHPASLTVLYRTHLQQHQSYTSVHVSVTPSSSTSSPFPKTNQPWKHHQTEQRSWWKRRRACQGRTRQMSQTSQPPAVTASRKTTEEDDDSPSSKIALCDCSLILLRVRWSYAGHAVIIACFPNAISLKHLF